jgi:molybdate transport system substrate-binding protein
MAAQPANTAHLHGISSMAMRDVLAQACDAWERRSGIHVTVEAVGGVDALRRVQAGEAFDFVVLAADAIARLAADARVDAATVTDLARSAIVVAVRAGAPRPDVSSKAALRDAARSVRAIGVSTGPSGRHLRTLLQRWGHDGATAAKLVEAPPGVPVATLIARGDVDIGFQQASELMHAPGIDIVGPLPQEIQAITVFSAAVCTTSDRRADTTALLDFLASAACDAARRRHGMEPARDGDGQRQPSENPGSDPGSRPGV